MNLVLIGPQGSGKGTQAELLSAKLKLPQLSVGQLYRDEIRRKTDIGRKVEKFVVRGDLVPFVITKKLLQSEFKKRKYQHGVLLDGYPRDLQQAKFLVKLIKIDYIILINIRQRETLKRLGGRRICPNCGETYHLLRNRPKRDMICDLCGHKLVHRTDDYPQAIKERLKIYKARTIPMVLYFQKKGRVIKINGEAPIKKIFSQILIKLKKSELHDNL